MTGLPDGIIFRKPSTYGKKQVRKIMENEKAITFHLVEDETSKDLSACHQNMHKKILRKIIDNDKVDGCLSKDKLIAEEDLEVNIDLLTSEYKTLMTELADCFEKDALKPLVASYDAAKVHDGYILPY